MAHASTTAKKVFPRWGWIGLLLIAVAWPYNWFGPEMRTNLAFFPLWLGYVLTMDALGYRQKGHSLLSRSPRRFVFLFLLSAPVWWIFEVFNLRLHNWVYLGRERVTDLQYAVLGTLDFSTVIPAVFTTAEWMAGHRWIQRFRPGPRLAPGRATPWLFLALGLLGIYALYAFPIFGFPLVWVAPYFLVEALNLWLGNRTLLDWTSRRDWRPLAALAFGTVFTGFFWEMWNYFAFPKWDYHIPFVEFWHVFEMPLLGYLGYIPFSFELFAIYHFVVGLLEMPRDRYVVEGLEAALRLGETR